MKFKALLAFAVVTMLSPLTSVQANQLEVFQSCRDPDSTISHRKSGCARTPAFRVQSNFEGELLLSNISDEEITITWQLTDVNGLPLDFTSLNVLLHRNFSSSNSPFSANGATLQPGELGGVIINSGLSSKMVNFGIVRWTSDKRTQVALVGTLKEKNGPNGSTVTSLNNGYPF